MVSVANELKGVVIGYVSTPQICCDFCYTGNVQSIELPRGTYCLEVRGASGGDVMVSTQTGNVLQSGMKIWAGTESNYSNLGMYDDQTVYLTF